MPAPVAIPFRSFLPDSGLCNLQVRRRAKTALGDNVGVFGEPSMSCNLLPDAAIFSWAYLPDIQRRADGVLVNWDLEELRGRMVKARMEGQDFMVSEKWQALRRRLRQQQRRA